MKSVTGIYCDDEQLDLFVELIQKNYMMGILFYLGVVSGLRIGDLLSLRVCDIGHTFDVRTAKTGKVVTVRLPSEGFDLLCGYVAAYGLSYDSKLFPISRQTVYRHFQAAGRKTGLEGIAPHSMRKTHAWNVLCATGDINSVKASLGHKYLSTTFIYLIGGVMWAVRKIYGGKFVPTLFKGRK
jgi:integrase